MLAFFGFCHSHIFGFGCIEEKSMRLNVYLLLMAFIGGVSGLSLSPMLTLSNQNQTKRPRAHMLFLYT